MRKLITTIGIAAVAIFGVAACSTDNNDESTGYEDNPATEHLDDAPTPAPPATEPTDTMQSWAITSGVTRLLDDIESDLGKVSSEAGAQDIAGTLSACRDLGTSVAAARPTLTSSPDATLNSTLGSALDAFSQASTSCTSFDFDSATAAMDRGSGLIRQATTIVQGYLS